LNIKMSAMHGKELRTREMDLNTLLTWVQISLIR
jgi:hypothetical protein